MRIGRTTIEAIGIVMSDPTKTTHYFGAQLIFDNNGKSLLSYKKKDRSHTCWLASVDVVAVHCNYSHSKFTYRLIWIVA